MTEEQLNQKISVPETLALAEPELKKKLVGKAPIQKYLSLLETLDPESEVYQSVDKEIKVATGYKEPEPEEDSGVVVLPVSSIKSLKTEIVAGLTSVGEKIDALTFPEPVSEVKITNFPAPAKPLKEISVSNFPKPVTEVSISNLSEITPLSEVSVKLPEWYKAPDSSQTDNTIKLTGDSVVGALVSLQEAMHDPADPLKVQIVNKKGEIIDRFGSVAVSGGGSSGGGTIYKDDAGFTVAQDFVTPIGGIYKTTLDELDDGDVGVLAMTTKRELYIAPQKKTNGQGSLVTVGTTAVELTFTITTDNITITSRSDNTGIIYIGKSDITNLGAGTLYGVLGAGDSVTLEGYDDSTNAVYAVSDTAGQKIVKATLY